jgi:class 3 adenylate cyclase
VQRPDGVSIAYQVVGEGPRDVVYVPGFISHLDLAWSEPGFVEFIRRMAGFSRLIMFDKPGTGLSDPIDKVPTLEERCDDLRVVCDAVGTQRPVLMGFSEGASSCLLFAATWPERVESMVLYGALVKGHPTLEELSEFGLTQQDVEEKWRLIHDVTGDWGKGRTIELLCPSMTSPAERRFWALFERAAASPRMARGLIAAAEELDVTPALSAISAPTLLIHNVDDFVPIAGARIVARTIPGAVLVETPGRDHAFWLTDPEPVIGEIEQFLTGTRAVAEPDRVLATVLFTDLVGSTEQAATLGDTRWREVLEKHDELVRRVVDAHRGRVVKTMGDGHLIVFDGPARAIRCAVALRDESEVPLTAGVHTGECESMGDDLGGLAVHIGARVAAQAAAGEVLVSSTVKDLVVGSELLFADRGQYELKGVPGTWRLFAVGEEDAPPPAVSPERELRPGDRMALGMARHAPRVSRSAVRLLRGGRR